MSELPDTGGTASRRRRPRRSWSRAEKQRIINEAFRPGASTADIARSYGLNANQVFNWRRRAAVATEVPPRGSSSQRMMPHVQTPSTPGAPIFLPIGTIQEPPRAEVSPAAASEVGKAVGVPRMAAAAMGGQAGQIKAGLIKAGLIKAGLIKAGLIKAGLIKAGLIKAGLIKAGLIEIDLPCGARLRVDCRVDERALRRVLSVLKMLP